MNKNTKTMPLNARKFLHIAVTKKEHDDFNAFCKAKALNKSAFVRQIINEKINQS